MKADCSFWLVQQLARQSGHLWQISAHAIFPEVESGKADSCLIFARIRRSFPARSSYSTMPVEIGSPSIPLRQLMNPNAFILSRE